MISRATMQAMRWGEFGIVLVTPDLTVDQMYWKTMGLPVYG
ncbi:MAG: hypothetical protein ACE5FT_00225 [Candidatus Nanoarchaeia archaeon]